MSAELPEPRIDPALREALSHARMPEPRAAFREKLRAEFLAAPFEAEDAPPLDEQELGPRPIVAPRWGDPAVLAGRAAAREEHPPPSIGTWKASPLWLRVVTIAGCAAALLVFLRWPTQHGWRVAPTSDFVSARLDGRTFGPNDGARLAAAIVPGTTLEVEGGGLDLALDRRLALHIAGGSTLRFVVVPERDVLDAMVLAQDRGSLAVVTGPDFSGSRLRVRTPDTEVRIVGTEFAVDIVPGDGTCVCCAAGTVQVFDAAGKDDPALEEIPSSDVGPEGQGLVSRKSGPAPHGTAQPTHVAPLERLRKLWPRAR